MADEIQLTEEILREMLDLVSGKTIPNHTGIAIYPDDRRSSMRLKAEACFELERRGLINRLNESRRHGVFTITYTCEEVKVCPRCGTKVESTWINEHLQFHKEGVSFWADIGNG